MVISRWKDVLNEFRGGYREEWKEAQEEMKKIKDIFASRRTYIDEIMEAMQNSLKEHGFIDDLLDTENSLTKRARALAQIQKQKKLVAEMYADNAEMQEIAMQLLESEEEKIKNSNDQGWVRETTEGVRDKISEGLSECLTDFDHFGDKIKDIGDDVLKYMLQQAVDAILQMAMQSKLMDGLVESANGAVNFGGGILGAIGNALKGLFGKHHSGGTILPSSGMLPGTQEQLALSKGGERVLSPSEAASYNDEEATGASQPLVFVNYNVKAWDSKDVQQYLLENASLLNSITAQGIRDNKHYLRTMIRNA